MYSLEGLIFFFIYVLIFLGAVIVLGLTLRLYVEAREARKRASGGILTGKPTQERLEAGTECYTHPEALRRAGMKR